MTGTAVEAKTLYVAKTSKKSENSTAATGSQLVDPGNVTLLLLFKSRYS